MEVVAPEINSTKEDGEMADRVSSGHRRRETVELDLPVAVPVSGGATRTLIVIVDLENEFCHPKGKVYLGPEAEEAVTSTSKLVERARSAGCRVLWVRSVRDADAVEVVAFGRTLHLLDGTWAVEYAEPLNVKPGEAVIAKHSHDCFNGTGLDEWLTAEEISGPDWLIVVAVVALPVCVNHAVIGFSARGFRVAVPLDCVAPRTGPGAAATLWHYGMAAYSYNISMTTSPLLELR